MKLKTIMIGSEQPKVLGEFYTKIFGKPDWQGEDWYGFADGIMVGPHSDIHGPNQNPARLMVNFETEELQDEYHRIKDLGALVVAEPYQPSKDQPEMWLATFADPDGNYFQIGTPFRG